MEGDEDKSSLRPDDFDDELDDSGGGDDDDGDVDCVDGADDCDDVDKPNRIKQANGDQKDGWVVIVGVVTSNSSSQQAAQVGVGSQ